MPRSVAEDARRIFLSTIAVCRADRIVARTCSVRGNLLTLCGQGIDLGRFERITLFGAGKASVEMCSGLAEIIDHPRSRGVAVTKHWDRSFDPPCEVIEAGHPDPNANSLRAGTEMLRLASEMTDRDLVIFSLSGGASALMESPLDNISLDDLVETNRVLLASGLPIHEINAIRKRISKIKNGGLARAFFPATVICLVLSDVIGNDLNSIGSAPLLAEELPQLNVIPDGLPKSVTQVLKHPKATPATSEVRHIILGDALFAAARAAEIARTLGYSVRIDNTPFEGEACELGRRWAEEAKGIPPKTVRIAYGESTVTLGKARNLGGRTQEAALAAAIELEHTTGTAVLVAGTDGVDGPTDAAGAVVDGASTQGQGAKTQLATHDSYAFHQAAGTHIKTGPTGTNLNELAILVRN